MTGSNFLHDFGVNKELLVAHLAYVDYEDPSAEKPLLLKVDCPKILDGIHALIFWF